MKILILGDMGNKKTFKKAEKAISEMGDIPINPIRVMYALPVGINISEFAVVVIELVRISDAILLLDGWRKDIVSTIAKTNAERSEKEVLTWTD
ncbi:MAG: DUF4406 domain-containing protein [Acetatifactor sp.]|nr:DUF4406 domain-containing protein [Acetatifactor sp.]